MTLLEVNHVITAIKVMLQGLVDNEVITGADSASLLPILVNLRLKNEVIETQG